MRGGAISDRVSSCNRPVLKFCAVPRPIPFPSGQHAICSSSQEFFRAAFMSDSANVDFELSRFWQLAIQALRNQVPYRVWFVVTACENGWTVKASQIDPQVVRSLPNTLPANDAILSFFCESNELAWVPHCDDLIPPLDEMHDSRLSQSPICSYLTIPLGGNLDQRTTLIGFDATPRPFDPLVKANLGVLAEMLNACQQIALLSTEAQDSCVCRRMQLPPGTTYLTQLQESKAGPAEGTCANQ